MSSDDCPRKPCSNSPDGEPNSRKNGVLSSVLDTIRQSKDMLISFSQEWLSLSSLYRKIKTKIDQRKLEKLYKSDVKPFSQGSQEENMVVNPDEETVSLYDDETGCNKTYKAEDLIGLILGDKQTLERFGHTLEDEDLINKKLLTFELSQLKNSKEYLCKILCYDFPEKSNNFSAVGKAAWLVLFKYYVRDKDWVYRVFKEVLQTSGNRIAKISCIYYAAQLVDEEFLDIFRQIIVTAENSKDEDLKKAANRGLCSLNNFLKNNVTTEELLFSKIPKLV